MYLKLTFYFPADLRLGPEVTAVRPLTDPDPARPVRASGHQELGSGALPHLRAAGDGLPPGRPVIDLPRFPGIEVDTLGAGLPFFLVHDTKTGKRQTYKKYRRRVRLPITKLQNTDFQNVNFNLPKI
jgi:hypothetical protein